MSGGMPGKRRCAAGRRQYAETQVASIRVLVCDDVAAFRALMRYTLPEDPAIEVVGEAGDGVAAIESAAQLQPDVVLLDLTMPRLDGIDAIPAVLERAPHARVVALSGWGADRMADAALAQGAVAYLEKSDDVQAIRDAVRAAAAGD
jgi:DNA-binding NarL/FixJ family response regulator